MQIPFAYGGQRGHIDVCCVPMTDPVRQGKSPKELGLPACTATISFPAEGYWALLGWVQLVAVGPPGQPPVWVADPFDLFEDSTSPYAWFGIRPTLFDAPSRLVDTNLRWRARSFLATTPWDESGRIVRPLAAFEWGFDLDGRGEVAVCEPIGLPLSEWASHTAYLRARYPRWVFTGP